MSQYKGGNAKYQPRSFKGVREGLVDMGVAHICGPDHEF
jgi:hypothetical protein